MCIISYRKKFIFIHNYKVAGTSIRAALQQYDIRNDLLSRILNKLSLMPEIDRSIYGTGHQKGSEIRAVIGGEIYDKYFKFGFVRNPWDWQVSWYNFVLKAVNHPQHHEIIKLKDFTEFVHWRMDNIYEYQKDFFYDSNNNLIVDFIGRYESLQNDFLTICKNINVSGNKLPQKNISTKSKSNYLDYYNEKTLDMIEEAYRPDIELFGYSKPVLLSSKYE